MLDVDSNRFRREAGECRRNAEHARNPSDREAWLRLAEDWMKLAYGEDVKHGSKPLQLVRVSSRP
jgi:hypothetical protein